MLRESDCNHLPNKSVISNKPSLDSRSSGKLDTKQLQVEISNLISDFEKKKVAGTSGGGGGGGGDSVTRLKVEELIFEVSYKFMVNKNFDVHSNEFELIRELMADPSYNQVTPLIHYVRLILFLLKLEKSSVKSSRKCQKLKDFFDKLNMTDNFSFFELEF